MIINKIQKLLALAQSANEHEALAASTKAHELLAKHNLTLAEVTAADESATIKPGHLTAHSKHSGPWVRQLWAATARLYFCEYVYSRGNHRTNHWIIGSQENTQVAAHMAEYLTNTVLRLAKSQPSGPSRNAFVKGCARKVEYRLIKKREDANAFPPTTSTTLPAVYNQHEKLNKEYMESFFGKLRSTTRKDTNPTDNKAYTEGVKAGASIGLNTQLATNTNQGLIT